MNVVAIVGNLTRGIELKYTQGGKAIGNLSIAVNRSYTKDGEKIEEVSFFDVVTFGATAENCQKYLSKGSKVAVTGELRQNRWEQEGQKRSRVVINASRVDFLSTKKESQEQTQSNIGQPNETALNNGWDE